MLLPDSDDEDSGLKKKSKAKKSNKPKKPSPKTVAKTVIHNHYDFDFLIICIDW